MPFFSLRTTKSSSSIYSQSCEDLSPNCKNKERAFSLTNGNTTPPSPKSIKTSPKKVKKYEEIEEESNIPVEPTPLHPFLQTPRRNSRTSSVKATTPPLPKLSSSFSPTNKYISNIHQYSRKRSNSMDATELAKTLDVYNAMKEMQMEDEKRKQLLSSELNSSSLRARDPSSQSNKFSVGASNSTNINLDSSGLNIHHEQSSSSSDLSSDEEKLKQHSSNSDTSDEEMVLELSHHNTLNGSSQACLSGDEVGGKKPPPAVELNNVSRKEFKKLPHLRKRVARNSLKTQLEMSKEKEAIELEKEAKKFASRSLTRWKPDYDSAGAAYEKAGAIFKALKQPGKAISCFTNSGECFYKCGIYYKSGTGYENAANICKDTKEFDTAVELYTKASHSYLDDGKGNRAGEAMTKAAKMLAENGNIPQAIELYRSAVESLSMGGTYHNAMSTFRAYNDFLIRNSQWEEAVSNSLEMIVGYRALTQHDNVNKTCTSIVLICLKMDDFVRADEFHKKFQSEHDSYGTSKESEISEDFLEAFERMDSNSLESAKQLNHLKYLEASVYRMVSKLSLSGGIGESTTQTKKPRPPRAIDTKKASLLSHEEDESEEENQISESKEEQIPEENDDAFDPSDLT